MPVRFKKRQKEKKRKNYERGYCNFLCVTQKSKKEILTADRNLFEHESAEQLHISSLTSFCFVVFCLLLTLCKLSTLQKSDYPQIFYEIGDVENFAKFTRKQLCKSLFQIQLQASSNFVTSINSPTKSLKFVRKQNFLVLGEKQLLGVL